MGHSLVAAEREKKSRLDLAPISGPQGRRLRPHNAAHAPSDPSHDERPASGCVAVREAGTRTVRVQGRGRSEG